MDTMNYFFEQNPIRTFWNQIKKAYREQIPASVFMAFIGVIACIGWMVDPSGKVGKGALNLLTAFFSIDAFGIIFLAAVSLLLLASFARLLEEDGEHAVSASLSNCAIHGYSSFFVPISTLCFVVTCLITFALAVFSKQKLDALGVTFDVVHEAWIATIVVFILPVLLCFISALVLSIKPKWIQFVSGLVMFSLWFVPFSVAIK